MKRVLIADVPQSLDGAAFESCRVSMRADNIPRVDVEPEGCWANYSDSAFTTEPIGRSAAKGIRQPLNCHDDHLECKEHSDLTGVIDTDMRGHRVLIRAGVVVKPVINLFEAAREALKVMLWPELLDGAPSSRYEFRKNDSSLAMASSSISFTNPGGMITTEP
jgi:hypothetical protein